MGRGEVGGWGEQRHGFASVISIPRGKVDQPYFTEEETEALRCNINGLRLCSQFMVVIIAQLRIVYKLKDILAVQS